MAQSELFPETITNPSELGYLAAESVNYRDRYSNATLFNLLRALAKSKRIRLAHLRPQQEMIEIIKCSSIDEVVSFLHGTYYNTMMGEGWKKKFEPNVAYIKKVEPDMLPENFEVVELRQKVKC